MVGFTQLLSGSPWRPESILCPVGRLVGATCTDPVPDRVVDQLHPDERRYATQLTCARRREWSGGRYCLAEALKHYTQRVPVLTKASGAPSAPQGLFVSITHKRFLTLAVATDQPAGIGVDLEYVEPQDEALAAKVLTARERMLLRQVDEDEAAALVTMHFALKEAVFKAASAEEQDSMEFQDIELYLSPVVLERQNRWEYLQVSVRGLRVETRGLVLRDGLWIAAIATRSVGPTHELRQ